eukprot:TRINITY_DN4385_c0_g1_i1.p1 TRINITY_DN4385_c0_g1~~TRINITY_DN4385_c0_g1_i1.p1  ORF type:complete len:451 (+),score=34.16 TRINITY_DN4385_c0_g1_i1:81-1433(+)
MSVPASSSKQQPGDASAALEQEGSKTVTINVKNTKMPDKAVTMQVPIQARVLDIKQAIQKNFPGNPPVRDQMLIYLGKVLQEDNSLVKDFIQLDETTSPTLHLVIKSSSGQQQRPPLTSTSQKGHIAQTDTPSQSYTQSPQVNIPQSQQQVQTQVGPSSIMTTAGAVPSMSNVAHNTFTFPMYHPVALAAAHGAAMAAYTASMQAQGNTQYSNNSNTQMQNNQPMTYPLLMNQMMYYSMMPLAYVQPPQNVIPQLQLLPQQQQLMFDQRHQQQTHIRHRPGHRVRAFVNPRVQQQQQVPAPQQQVNQNGNPNQRAVRTMVLRINLRAIIQLLIVAVVLYQNSSPDRFLLIMALLIVLYFTAWGPIQRALQRAAEGFRQQQQQYQGQNRQQDLRNRQPNQIFREIWMLLVGLFTSLLPGMNINQEDAAIFAQAQEQIAREENQPDERPHQD